MQLAVRLITEEMLYNSITVRLNDMTAEQFLSPLLGFFIDGLAAIIPCPKENIYIFSIQVLLYFYINKHVLKTIFNGLTFGNDDNIMFFHSQINFKI